MSKHERDFPNPGPSLSTNPGPNPAPSKTTGNSASQQTGEFGKIETIRKRIGALSKNTLVGIGDDAAVVTPPVGKMLFCSDAMVEGVHFDFHYTSARELGHKAVASVLSDIAAMNGRAKYAVVSLALPANLDEDFVDEFYAGAGALARHCGVDIVGGDLSSSPQTVFVDVAVIGETETPALRSGAKPNDYIVVSGSPGRSAAGLLALKNREKTSVSKSLLQAHLQPQPRFDLLKTLPPKLVTSMIDISDGISSEILHIAARSQVGFEIDAKFFPIDAEVLKEVGSLEQAVQLALSGGEDYELLATFDAQMFQDLGLSLSGFTVIGKITPSGEGQILIDLDGSRSTLSATGYNHFATHN